jgi:transcriptional regulator with XRE-family HTH domain
MAKAFDEDTNALLRKLAQALVDSQFNGTQAAFAKAIGLTPGFVSDFLNENRGAGLDLLRGVARYAPLELLEALQVDPRTVVLLAVERAEGGSMGKLPNELARAARAAIELLGCTPAVALRAADAAFAEHGEFAHGDPDWWLGKMREHIKDYQKSGERPSVNAKPAKLGR